MNKLTLIILIFISPFTASANPVAIGPGLEMVVVIPLILFWEVCYLLTRLRKFKFRERRFKLTMTFINFLTFSTFILFNPFFTKINSLSDLIAVVLISELLIVLCETFAVFKLGKSNNMRDESSCILSKELCLKEVFIVNLCSFIWGIIITIILSLLAIA